MEIQNLLDKLSDTLHAGRAFGPATEHGAVTVIPVALVIGGGGGGMGTEPTTPSAGGAAADAPSTVIGSGGGFGTVSWPLGVYAVTQGDVRWVPALDATRLAVAAIGLVKLVAKLRARRRAG